MTEKLLSGLPTADEAPKARPVENGELLRPGQDIAARYVVRERLGRGGMGAVWRVYDRKLDEDVALKVILPDRMVDPTALARFRDEVKLARKITHGNVCRVFDIGESDALVFLTMELIEGTTLRKLLVSDPIETHRAIDMLQQVVSGVAAAHERGIVHRDIKPENVLVRRDGRCLVADFGLAYRPDMSSQEVAAGTPAYMSPEQLRGENLDIRSDVYALGLLAFELLSGQAPDVARHAVASGELPPLDRIAEPMQSALCAVIKRALAEEPKDRFESAAALGAELSRAWERIENRSAREAMSQEEALAPTVPVFKPQAARIRRRRWPWLVAAPFVPFAILVLLAQLPRGDLRHWRPFSSEDDSTKKNDTETPITPETRSDDRPAVTVMPFENLAGDEVSNGLSRSAHATVRDALRTIPEVALVDDGADAKPSDVFRVRGNVQRTAGKPRIVVQIEATKATDETLLAEPVEVVLDSDESAAFATLRRDAIDEIRLLVRHWRKRQRATVGTKNDEARAKLLQYHAMVGFAPKRQHVEAGMALLNAALALDSAYLPALVERAYLRTVGGEGSFESRVAKSIVDLDAARKVTPDDPEAAVMRCRVMQVATVAGARATDKQIQDAREACQKALQLAPSSAFVLVALARLSDLVCQDDETIRLLQQGLDLDRGLQGRILNHLVELTLLRGQLNVADKMSAAMVSLQQEEERLRARAYSWRAGGSPVKNAHWLRGVVLLRRGLADEARQEFEKELDSITAGSTEVYVEAATLRGLAKADGLRHKKLAPDLERRLAQLEAQFRSEVKTIPDIALDVGDRYSRVDPEAAVEWLERTEAGSSCSDTVNRSLVYLKAGKRDLARRTLDVCGPTQEWERSCIADVRRLIGD